MAIKIFNVGRNGVKMRMKKLLGLITVVLVGLLVACGGGNTTETVCTSLFDEGLITFQSRDGEVISITHERRYDVSNWSENEIQEEIELATGTGISYEHNENMLSILLTQDAETVERIYETLDLEALIVVFEETGFVTCD